MPDAPTAPATPGAPRLVRWKAVVPFTLFLVLVVVGWTLFADRLGRLAVARGGTAILGARVDVQSFHISIFRGNATVRGLVAASPFDSLQNLMEAGELVADLDLLPLLEKKVVIDRLAATRLRFGTPRTTSGFVPSRGSSATTQIMGYARAWAAQPALQVPLLRLATGALSIDSLDPRRLQTVQAAESLAARADSSRRAWTAAVESLDVQATAESASAFARRLQGARPTDLRLIGDARRTLERVKQTRDRLTALEGGVRAGAGTLDQGLAALATARQRDYAFAKSLVKLPPIDASGVGWVLFGPAAVAKFERALYYTRLARAYMPPGLLPRATPAPARRAGSTVRFPRERALPGFLLRDAQLSLLLGPDSALKTYAGRLQGLTTAPALYGRPTTLEVRAPTLSVDAQFDHVHAPPKDIVGGTLRGVALPAIRLPGLPIAVVPGRGDVSLGFALYGDSLRGRWQVRAPAARWRRDSAASSDGGPAADLLWQVVSGIDSLDLTAELGGTVNRPTLHVRSNLDRAVADRLRAVVGDQVTAAEARVRAQVDRIADERVAPVRAQVAKVTADANALLAERRQALETAQQQLEQQVKRLTGGIRLP
jgi:uncharacterized protein (TIGR03545 family)